MSHKVFNNAEELRAAISSGSIDKGTFTLGDGYWDAWDAELDRQNGKDRLPLLVQAQYEPIRVEVAEALGEGATQEQVEVEARRWQEVWGAHLLYWYARCVHGRECSAYGEAHGNGAEEAYRRASLLRYGDAALRDIPPGTLVSCRRQGRQRTLYLVGPTTEDGLTELTVAIQASYAYCEPVGYVYKEEGWLRIFEPATAESLTEAVTIHARQERTERERRQRQMDLERERRRQADAIGRDAAANPRPVTLGRLIRWFFGGGGAR